MKKIAYIVSFGLMALSFSSCCSLGVGCGSVSIKSASKDCGVCGSTYCASPGCCGVVGKAVLKRATTQNGNGNPHLGQIPTMKVLAE